VSRTHTLCILVATGILVGGVLVSGMLQGSEPDAPDSGTAALEKPCEPDKLPPPAVSARSPSGEGQLAPPPDVDRDRPSGSWSSLHDLGPREVQIRVVPASPAVAGLAVTVLWSVDPATREAVETALLTDAGGFARALLSPPRGTIEPRADFAFPTLGAAVRTVPGSGEPAVLEALPLGSLAITVAEADGSPLRERASVRLRSLRADPPGDRWHVLPLREGRAESTVEARGLELDVEVRTASGRSARTLAKGPGATGGRTECSLRLPPGEGIGLRLVLPGGSPLADAEAEVLCAWDGSSATNYPQRCDANGWLVLHLPEFLRRQREPLRFFVHVPSPTGPHGAELLVPPLILANGGSAGTVQLRPSSRLVAGTVQGPSGEPIGDVPVLLEVEPQAAAGAPARPWRRLASAVSAPDGSFSFWHPAPEGSRLRLRLGGLLADRSAPVLALPGDDEVVLAVRRRNGG